MTHIAFRLEEPFPSAYFFRITLAGGGDETGEVIQYLQPEKYFGGLEGLPDI